jgi:hypothetical protein
LPAARLPFWRPIGAGGSGKAAVRIDVAGGCGITLAFLHCDVCAASQLRFAGVRAAETFLERSDLLF